jgi:hypothetical protein
MEFIDYIPSEPEMDMCMEMNGGGMFNVGPGQVTDDSELAMSLLNEILEGILKQ